MAGPDAGRFNNSGRRSWWYGRDVDAVLAHYGHRTLITDIDGPRVPLYFPQAQSMEPPAPPLQMPPPQAQTRWPTAAASSRSGGVVIRDGHHATASTPSRRGAPVKKEVKEEPASLPRGRLHLHRRLKKVKKEEAAAQTPPEKPWWMVEAEALAAAYGGNPEEFPGEHLIRSRSVNEDYRQVTLDKRQAELWATMDSGAVVDLDGPSELPAPKEEEDSFDLYDFSDDDGGGDGNGADSMDWSAFDGRRC